MNLKQMETFQKPIFKNFLRVSKFENYGMDQKLVFAGKKRMVGIFYKSTTSFFSTLIWKPNPTSYWNKTIVYITKLQSFLMKFGKHF